MFSLRWVAKKAKLLSSSEKNQLQISYTFHCLRSSLVWKVFDGKSEKRRGKTTIIYKNICSFKLQGNLLKIVLGSETMLVNVLERFLRVHEKIALKMWWWQKWFSRKCFPVTPMATLPFNSKASHTKPFHSKSKYIVCWRLFEHKRFLMKKFLDYLFCAIWKLSALRGLELKSTLCLKF